MSKSKKSEVSVSKPVDTSDRRKFIKNTIVGAGTVAAGLATMSVTAEASQRGGFKGIASAHFGRTTAPTLAEVQATIERIVTQYGCRTCGLLGFDIRLTTINPPSRVTNVDVKGGALMFEQMG